MMKLSLILVLAACLALTIAEPKVPRRGVIHEIRSGVAGPNPYIFLTIPQGRSQTLVQGFEVMDDEDDENNNDDDDQQDDDDDDDNDDLQDDDDEDQVEDNMPKNESDINNDNDDDEADDDEEEFHDVMNMQMQMKKQQQNLQIKNAKPTQMMISRENAGALMVPDEIIEIEGQSVIDEKTGKPALLLPRAILDTIPDGSVVALMERAGDNSAEARANRVLVRRRRKGARRNVKRRRAGNNKRRRGGNKKRRGGNNKRRRGGNKRKNVRVIRNGGNNRRRNNNKRRNNNRRRVVYQG